MTRKKLVTIILPIAILVIILAASIYYFGFARDIQITDETVIATVGDQEIYAYEINYLMAVGYPTVDEAIDYMGEYKAMLQKAADNGIVLTEEDKQAVADELSQMAEYYGGETQLVSMLQQYGLTKEQYQKIGEMSKVVTNFQSKAQELGLMKTVTEEEAKAYYDQNFLRAKHILFSNTDEEGNPIDDATLLAQVTEVYNKIKNGEPFEDFLSLSADPGAETAPDGYIFLNASEMKKTDEETVSMLANMGVSIMVDEFENATANLEIGQVSEPVKTSYGYHIIKRLDINETPQLFEDNKDIIISALESLAFEDLVDEWAAEYPVKKNERAVRSLADQIAAEQEAAAAAQSQTQTQSQTQDTQASDASASDATAE